MAMNPSNSNSHPPVPAGTNGHTKSPLYAILGGGLVADLVLWRNLKSSAMFLVGVVSIWILFGAVNYTFVTLLCHICIVMMLVLFAWSSGARFFNWNSPNVRYLTVPESAFRLLFTNLNWLLLSFYAISSGKNWKHFIMVLGSMWMLSVIGKHISSLNLICLVLLGSLTGPAIYERWGTLMGSVADVKIS